jgi:3-hydroxyisobutyrate dehydrogenase-like beta-hydroxyacid dehydrogenase
VRIYIPQHVSAVHDLAKKETVSQIAMVKGEPTDNLKVGFVGLGAMGVGMASSLAKAGFHVSGYDVYQPSIQKFLAAGGTSVAARSPAEAARDAQILILMVQNASQAEDVLFGTGKAGETLPDRSVVILSSTVAPSFVRRLGERLQGLGRHIELIDAPVSGGVARAAQGQLTVSGANPLESELCLT